MRTVLPSDARCANVANWRANTRVLATSGDVAVAVSTSGKSRVVIEAVLCAGQIGLFTVGLKGPSGGRPGDSVDALIGVARA
jgi:phosphoheptose isomerase